MKVTIVPASLVLRPKPGGLGYDLCREGAHYATFSVGNITVNFSGRNTWSGPLDSAGEVLELHECADDPVLLDGYSVSDHADPAVLLLYALADDLGYSVSRDEYP